MPSERLFTRFEYHEQTHDYAMHFHNAYQMILVMDGQVNMRFEKSVYTVQPQSLVWISNLEEHAVRIEQAPYRRYFATLHARRVDEAIGDMTLLSLFRNRPAGFVHVWDVRPIIERVEALFIQMRQEYRQIRPYNEQMGACLLRELLICLYRHMPERFPLPDAHIAQKIDDVRQYIDRHFAQPMQIGELARRFYISPCYLSHSFKALSGYSPKQYLLRTRLSYARELLGSTALPVGQIAHRSGFGDVNHFIRSFRAHYGDTPGALRRARAISKPPAR